jgi:glyoxylase-like metal-dependent hydrolase (beta-lactamase superfamily II)
MRQRTSAASVALRAAAMCAALGVAGAPALSDVAHAQEASGQLQVLPVRGNVFMISGAGGHVTLSAGADGLMLIDAGSAAMADQLLATITEVGTMAWAAPTRLTTCVGPSCYGPGSTGAFTPYGYASPAYNAIVASPAPLKPLRWIIQTSVDPDHVGGTPTLAAAGRSYAGGNLTTILGDEGASEGAILIAQEKVLLRMTESNYPEGAWALETYYIPTYKMSHYVNGEGVQLYHAPNAITDGDTFVHFKYSDVISAGDLYTSDRYPMIDTAKGGTVQGVIDGLNHILDIAYPEFRHQGGTMVIPGHGRIGDSADVTAYKNMVSIVRDRIQELINEGKSLDEIKAFGPTLDYDGVYGSPDAFIEAVHQNLTATDGTGSR